MSLIYNLSIYFYWAIIRLASLFNQKAKLWISGRKGLFKKMALELNVAEDIIWFHAASLGEFEQGRPVIESFRIKFPDHKILLTFFSPSGYEIRKKYTGADFIYYLPIDTKSNAKKFIRIVNPKIAVFIKYEYWYNYISLLKDNHIPVFIISAIFRPKQYFFKWYGGWFRKKLKSITYFFVQNQVSIDLLNSIDIRNARIAGDTRFDRVYDITQHAKDFPLIEKYTSGKKVLLGGSTWPPDEALILDIAKSTDNYKFIIAPHDIGEERISFIQKNFSAFNPLRLSEANDVSIQKTDVLIIDGMGFLSSIYQYSHIAFIGGGFGKGIHNILEAVTFGKPVIFGPKYQKFDEARTLLKAGGAFTVKNKDELNKIFQLLSMNEDFYSQCSDTCRKYIVENTGATKMIIEKLETVLN
ncbi:MAG: 3-deoxy-D-manno-octulosonic acid transferase [Bacteroidales bacterium]|nr:3-deoxy-D-manno-octulosonic acid transferase [Bacteroidales bacterium]